MKNVSFHKSGLKLILDKNDSPIVSCRLMVNVGSSNEDNDNKGVSHFLEHMVFNGTTIKSKEDILYKVPASGADQNAYTTFDHTVYMVNGTKSNFELCLDTLCDMVVNPSLDKEQIQKEINVVLQELGDAKNNPSSVAYRMFYGNIFQGEEISTDILGTEESIKNFTSEKTKEYHQKYYIPSNMVLSISGNYDETILNEIVEKYFLELNLKEQTNIIHKPRKQEIIKLQNDFNQDQVMFCYHYNWYDKLTVELMNHILGDGMSSILFRTIREEKGLVYSIYSYDGKIHDSKFITITAMCESDKTDEIISLVPTVARKTYLITEDELQAGKNKLMFSYAERFANSSNNADNNLNDYMYDGRMLSYDEIKKEVDKINIGSFANVARGILSQNPLIVASVAKSKN